MLPSQVKSQLTPLQRPPHSFPKARRRAGSQQRSYGAAGSDVVRAALGIREL